MLGVFLHSKCRRDLCELQLNNFVRLISFSMVVCQNLESFLRLIFGDIVSWTLRDPPHDGEHPNCEDTLDQARRSPGPFTLPAGSVNFSITFPSETHLNFQSSICGPSRNECTRLISRTGDCDQDGTVLSRRNLRDK